MRQGGSAIATLGNATITSPTGETLIFTFDAAALNNPIGNEIDLEINQDSGGTGPVANRAGFDIGSIDWIYEDGIGADRLVRQRACDGACCIAAPRFPLGAGTPADPHQGSDCEKRTLPNGKQFHGCTLIEDTSLQPPVGAKSLLNLMGGEDQLDIFIATCLLWPQNTVPTANIGDCCWIWEPDI